MEFFSYQSIIFLFLLTIYLYLYFNSSSKTKTINNKAGYKLYPFLGSLPEFLKNRHRFLDWSTDVLASCPTNTSTFYRPGTAQGIMTANPKNVEHMLKTNFENYPKGERFITLLQDFLGQGIFNSDGEMWKIQRKTASYEFNTKSLRNFAMANVVVEIQTRLVPVMKNASERCLILNLQDVLERFAFDNICKVAFNVDPACLGYDQKDVDSVCAEFMRAFDDSAVLSSGRFMYALPFLYKIKKILNMGSERVLKNSIVTVHEFADKIIQDRIKNSKINLGGQDLLSRFLANQENSPQFLRDIVVSFILAGRDTTSSALTWFFWLLSSNPDVKQRIQNELKTIRTHKTNNDSFYTFNEIRDMHYLHASISEALRLYPPVPADTKECVRDDIFPDGTFVGKGWFVTYLTYAMGRMESVWGPNCREFAPERWMENGVCKVECPFKFPVFHAGPRICLGKDMAYIQMKSIAACIIERFDLDVLEKDTCPDMVLSMTLRMKGGLPVRVKERL